MTTVTLSGALPPATRKAGIGGALRSEWTKIRSVRSTMWSLLAMAGISIGLMSLIAWATMHRWARFEPREQAALLKQPLEIILVRPVFVCQLVVAVLGVMVISSEYTTGMIRSTLQAQPRRLTVLAAKIAVFAVLMLVVGELLSFAAFGVGKQIIAGHIPVSLSDFGVTRSVIGAGLYLAVLGLFSLAFGAILRHTAGAITTVLGLILIVSNLTGLLPDSWGHHIHAWMPTNAGQLILQPHQLPDDLLSPWQGLGVFAGWTVLLLAVAAVLFKKRDA
ncbi:ABC transporter permease subunit [Planosporangium flavigriseum]|uniref:ABC transporter permease n=1 Tax=Planosporangium flavigriseum TaxID=373681 RepID=A0A8J3PLM0_9ACTN|nr:ABC transporter permease subunit [Planosporangium flavigriseum]NJC66528.1 ABC transporter permease subunit [Planosporangium flavigriseum]GIG73399.1 ABC transporter permease [Planosporangium flavigriseum]